MQSHPFKSPFGKGICLPGKQLNKKLINTLKCLSNGTPKTMNFPFVPNGKLMVLGVPIFGHIIRL